jgi:two-component system phosphate regulon sensor histidine kinase PhoR
MMFSSRLFWKLFLACAGVNLVAAAVFGLVVSGWQEELIIEQVDGRLRDAALLVRSALADQMSAERSEELQQQVRHLGQETETRFTLVTMDGLVLADSGEDSLAAVATMENHRNRPEIVHARARGQGVDQRVSGTLKEAFRYYAVRADVDGKPVGIVRAAITVAAIEAQAAAVRRLIWTLAGVIFLCVLAVSYWIVRRIINPVTSLTAAAEAVAAGNFERRVYVSNRDELGRLAGTFNRMSQELHTRMTELVQSNDRQTAVLEGMVEGVIAVDARQRILLSNRAAGRLFDVHPPAIEGRPLLEVVRNHELHQAVTTALATRRPQRLEIHRGGSEKLSTDVQVTPMPGDPCPGVVVVMHDTTELRRLESLRRDFIANVSHELKTPLTSIKAYAETLRGGAIDDRENSGKFLERIEEQAERLHKLILDMLMLARIESDQQAFDIGSVSVGEVVGNCLEGQRQAADAKAIRLVVEPEQPPVMVRADREGLRGILDNLVDNAIKYTPQGGQVTLRWNCDGEVAHIQVQDTGIGISEEDQRHVFERFYRVDKARSRELGGTGLGLSIVKHLVQSFDGRVEVKSYPGQGSTFTIELPLA